MRSSSKEHCPKNDQLKNVSLINRNVMNVSEMLKTSRQRMMRIILTHISILCKFKNCRFHYIICAQPNTIAPLVLLNFFSIYTFFLSKMSIFFSAFVWCYCSQKRQVAFKMNNPRQYSFCLFGFWCDFNWSANSVLTFSEPFSRYLSTKDNWGLIILNGHTHTIRSFCSIQLF